MANFSTGDLFDNRYQLLKELGGGQDAEVWTALDTLQDAVIVLKIFVRVGEKALDSFFDDFKLLKNIKHEHILKPFDIGKWESQPYQKIDFVKNGSIFKRIEAEKPFSEAEAAVFLSEVASALAYLHQHDIVHCDIKPENVLVKDDGSYTLTDFGISQKMKQIFARVTVGKDADISNFGFSRAYAPPEVSNKSVVKPSRDVFSLGASLYELLTCELPFDRDGGRALLMGVETPHLPETFSEDLNLLIHQCMSKNPDLRPTAGQLAAWANDFINTGTWNLMDKTVAMPSTKPTTIASRKTTLDYPKIEKTEEKPKNNTKWIIIGLIILGLISALYFITQKTDEVPKKEIVSQEKATIVPKKPSSINSEPKNENSTTVEATPVTKKPTEKPQPKNQPTVPPITKEKEVTIDATNEQRQRLDDLLNDGELAINENNNKSAAIRYFRQAQFVSQNSKLTNPRVEKLYNEYVKKGDAIFAAELYPQAKAWYLVAQSLKNTDEIKQKIEDCNK